MELTSDEFRKKLHSGELMGKSGGLKYILKTGKIVPDDKVVNKRLDRASKGKKRPIRAKIEAQHIGKNGYLERMDQWMDGFGIRFEREFKFCPDRRFRADRYLPDFNILVEYEGLGFSKDKKQKISGHTSLKGYVKDCQKYNLAANLGFKVYRYTAKNYREFIQLLEKLSKTKR